MQDNQRQTLWAYIAGVMDSDGCFMITRHNRKTLKRISTKLIKVNKWSATYTASAKLNQIQREAIDLIVNESGFGKIRLEGARLSRPNSSPIYTWSIRKNEEIISFLEKVIPWLRIKKNRAEFLLEYCKTIKPCAHPHYGLSKEELDYREQSYIKMRKFNDNKVAATTKSPGHESACDSLIS
jgi:hypothetical protein